LKNILSHLAIQRALTPQVYSMDSNQPCDIWMVSTSEGEATSS